MRQVNSTLDDCLIYYITRYFFENLFFLLRRTLVLHTRTASSLEAEAGAVGGNGLDSQLYKRVDSIHDTFTTTEALHFRN